MPGKTIMLCCAGGMSSSLLVKHMQDAAAADGVDARIFTVGAAQIGAVVAAEHPDVLLIGPQVRFVAAQWRQKLAIPVAVINMHDYGMMRGEQVLQTALQLMAGRQ